MPDPTNSGVGTSATRKASNQEHQPNTDLRLSLNILIAHFSINNQHERRLNFWISTIVKSDELLFDKFYRTIIAFYCWVINLYIHKTNKTCPLFVQEKANLG